MPNTREAAETAPCITIADVWKNTQRTYDRLAGWLATDFLRAGSGSNNQQPQRQRQRMRDTVADELWLRERLSE